MNTTTQTQSAAQSAAVQGAATQSAVTFESVFQAPDKLSFTLANGLSVKIGKNPTLAEAKLIKTPTA
jgi:hypothetical protein